MVGSHRHGDNFRPLQFSLRRRYNVFYIPVEINQPYLRADQLRFVDAQSMTTSGPLTPNHSGTISVHWGLALANDVEIKS
ncbi:hypothetical protein XANCAGTX0491_001888 [Xanthoria calcicola]